MSSSPLSVVVRMVNGDKFDVQVPSASITVRELKKLVEVASKVPADVQRLIFSGHVLKDESTLESYKIVAGVSIHLVKSAVKATPAASTTTATATTTTTTTTTTAGAPPSPAAAAAPAAAVGAGAGGVPAPMPFMFGGAAGGNGAAAANPFAALLGGMPAGGAGGAAGVPPVADIMAILQDPMFLQTMQMMTQNPQLMQQALNNPMMQQMAQNDPQVAAILQNPAAMQQSLAMLGPLLQLQQQQQQLAAGAGSGVGGGGGGAPAFNPAMFGAFAAQQQQQAALPPAERFATQLLALGEMGFVDRDECIQVLLRTNGNVPAAVEILLSR